MCPLFSPGPQSSRIGVDEDVDDLDGKPEEEVTRILAEREANANAQILEMVRMFT